MVPNFIKYLTDIRAYFTIKNIIVKNNVMSIIIRPIFFFFFKSIIGLNQIFGRSQLLFFRLNLENIKIIIYIYIYFKKKFKILGGPPLHIATPLLIGLMGVNLESSKMC